MDTVFNEITRISAEVFERPDLRMRAEDSPLDIDGWDSLTHIMLISAIENHYSIHFGFRDLASIQTFGDLVNMAESKIKNSKS